MIKILTILLLVVLPFSQQTEEATKVNDKNILADNQYTIKAFKDATNTIATVKFTSGGRTLYASSFDGKLRVYKVNSNNSLELFQTYAIFTSSTFDFVTDVSDNQTYMISSNGNTTIFSYKFGNQYIYKQNITQSGNRIDNNFLTPDALAFTTCNSGSNKTTLWRVNSSGLFDKVQQYNLTGLPFRSFIQQPYHFIGGGFNTTIYIRNDTGYIFYQALPEYGIYDLTVTPDLQLLITGSYDGQLRIYMYNGTFYKYIQSFDLFYSIRSVTITPDSQYLLIGLQNKTSMLYMNKQNVFSLVQVFKQSTAEVYTVSIGNGAQLFASSGRDSTLRAYIQCGVPFCSSCSWINTCQSCVDGYQFINTGYCQKLPENDSSSFPTYLVIIIIVLAVLLVCGVIAFILYKKGIICKKQQQFIAPYGSNPFMVDGNPVSTDEYYARQNNNSYVKQR